MVNGIKQIGRKSVISQLIFVGSVTEVVTDSGFICCYGDVVVDIRVTLALIYNITSATVLLDY